MRRQLFAFLCAAALAATGAQAVAADPSGADASNSAVAKGPAPKTKAGRHEPSPRKPAPDTSDINKDTTAGGAVQAGKQTVKTDKTLNNNTMKILPP